MRADKWNHAGVSAQFRHGRKSHRRKRHQFHSDGRNDELFDALVQIGQHDGGQSARRVAARRIPGELLRLRQGGKFGRKHNDADNLKERV